jgi:hypothetical protein
LADPSRFLFCQPLADDTLRPEDQDDDEHGEGDDIP